MKAANFTEWALRHRRKLGGITVLPHGPDIDIVRIPFNRRRLILEIMILTCESRAAIWRTILARKIRKGREKLNREE